jgi:hypothetical protein
LPDKLGSDRPTAVCGQIELQSLRAELPIARRVLLTATLAAHLIIADRPGDAVDAMAEVVDIAPTVGFSARGLDRGHRRVRVLVGAGGLRDGYIKIRKN